VPNDLNSFPWLEALAQGLHDFFSPQRNRQLSYFRNKVKTGQFVAFLSFSYFLRSFAVLANHFNEFVDFCIFEKTDTVEMLLGREYFEKEEKEFFFGYVFVSPVKEDF